MASGLDMNGSVLSYFEGTANLHFYFTEDAFDALQKMHHQRILKQILHFS